MAILEGLIMLACNVLTIAICIAVGVAVGGLVLLIISLVVDFWRDKDGK